MQNFEKGQLQVVRAIGCVLVSDLTRQVIATVQVFALLATGCNVATILSTHVKPALSSYIAHASCRTST